MHNVAKLFALIVILAAAGGDVALAWERAPAPIEFATRAARPSSAASPNATTRVRALSDQSTAARRGAAIAMDQPDILYGYGRASDRTKAAPLDLRGRLRATGGGETLPDDAFDAAAPSAPVEAPPVLQEAVEGAAAPDLASQDVTGPDTSRAPVVPETQSLAGAYLVQVGAFADPANAERARSVLQDVGSVTIDQRQGPSATLHRVRLGQWPTRAAAELACDMIVERGFAGAVVVEGR